MKKFIMITSLCLVLTALCVGCKNEEKTPSEGDNNISGEIGNIDSIEDEEELPDDIQPGFTADILEGVSDDMQTVIKNICETSEATARMGYEAIIDAERSEEFIGLSTSDFETNVVDSVVYESQIMPSNNSLCIIKVKDGADKEALKKTIFEKCNPMKWVCMSAEYVLVVDNGNYIMLSMNTEENCKALKDAFANEFDKSIGTVLEKAIAE